MCIENLVNGMATEKKKINIEHVNEILFLFILCMFFGIICFLTECAKFSVEMKVE